MPLYYEPPYNNTVIVGSCSICGGNVVLPSVWWSVVAPIARCSTCGATEKKDLPVIPMEQPGHRGVPYQWPPDVTCRYRP